VTITGANVARSEARPFLTTAAQYPSAFDSSVTRRLLYGETVPRDVRVRHGGGVRVENEHGTSGKTSSKDRNNYGAFVEGRRHGARYLYVNGGLGFDHNRIFGTPGHRACRQRLSAAGQTAGSTFGIRRLTSTRARHQGAERGPGIVLALRAAAGGTAGSLGVQPIGPERSVRLTSASNRVWRAAADGFAWRTSTTRSMTSSSS